jgi:hypothetical protein
MDKPTASDSFTGIYVDLDTILDTRMGTLFDPSNPSKYEKYILSGRYFNRDEDNFPDTDMEEYREKYSKRNSHILDNSLITGILREIYNLCVINISSSMYNPVKQIPRIILNTYPYNLGLTEKNKIIRAIAISLKDLPEIELVYMSLEEVTVRYIKEKISFMYLYHWFLWLEIHALNGGFKRLGSPETILFAPRLYMDKSVIENDKESLNHIRRDPDYFFKMVQELSRPFIDLQFMPVEMFCFTYRGTDDTDKPEDSSPENPEDNKSIVHGEQ